ncbi:hypothetical protein IJ541_04180 [bacterium]|nr:hypothetical protein [bacterium]
MQVYSITPTNNLDKNIKKNNQNITKPDYKITKPFEFPRYNQISFEGIRVDKGLERFFQFNKDRIPSTVYRYVEALVDKFKLTPLEAQQRAFKELKQANSAMDIKKLFPDEELFEGLIEPESSKATRGILNTYRENRELLKLCNQDILSNRENLTVYLVKKIFLEGKTLDEINKDLEKDLDKDFITLFKSKNPESTKFIQESTLKALGIKSPASSYQQSLRYTRDGYSDLVGENISKAQRLFWESLSDEERTARAKRSVEKFEKWWDGLSYKEKIDMLAEQDNKLEILAKFKQSDKSAKPTKITPQNEAEQANTEIQQNQHTHVGSNKLSQDELFIKWATNNLKIFEEGLSEHQKDILNLARMNKQIARWQKMTPAQRTEYISKMKAGSEPMRYAMIDAWNNSENIILDLSKHLKENQIYRPDKLLFSSEEFSEFQSRTMTEFWEAHPEYAIQLGEKIKASQEKVRQAINNGTFEALKKEIMRDRSRRINEIVAIKLPSKSPQTSPKIETPQAPKTPEPINPKPQIIQTYKDEFIELFNLSKFSMFGQVKNQPDKYVRDYAKTIAEELPEEVIKIWTKGLKNGYQTLSQAEFEYLKRHIAKETPAMAKLNRAFEAAMASIVEKFTGSTKAYELSQSDLKTVMYHLERGEQPIEIISHKNNQRYVFNIIQNPKKIDKKQINRLYEQYLEELPEEQVEEIANKYFAPNLTREQEMRLREPEKYSEARIIDDMLKELNDYIATFGRSILIAYSEKSKFSPNVRQAFNLKFLNGMPDRLKNQDIIKPVLTTLEDMKREQYLGHLRYLFMDKYSFMPQSFLNIYFDRLSHSLRLNKNIDLHSLDAVCTKRKTSIDKSRMITLRDSLQANKKEILAMEQALADSLYEATGEPRVYALKLESLMDKLELFRVAKNFPTTPTQVVGTNNEELYLVAKRKPNYINIAHKYKEYLEEIIEWEKTDLKGKKPENYNELLYILNPENGKEMIDMFTGIRMASFGLNTSVGKVNINVK